jgi:hypothetical protein
MNGTEFSSSLEHFAISGRAPTELTVFGSEHISAYLAGLQTEYLLVVSITTWGSNASRFEVMETKPTPCLYVFCALSLDQDVEICIESAAICSHVKMVKSSQSWGISDLVSFIGRAWNVTIFAQYTASMHARKECKRFEG